MSHACSALIGWGSVSSYIVAQAPTTVCKTPAFCCCFNHTFTHLPKPVWVTRCHRTHQWNEMSHLMSRNKFLSIVFPSYVYLHQSHSCKKHLVSIFSIHSLIRFSGCEFVPMTIETCVSGNGFVHQWKKGCCPDYFSYKTYIHIFCFLKPFVCILKTKIFLKKPPKILMH